LLRASALDAPTRDGLRRPLDDFSIRPRFNADGRQPGIVHAAHANPGDAALPRAQVR
jgi:hypothetical protein